MSEINEAANYIGRLIKSDWVFRFRLWNMDVDWIDFSRWYDLYK